MAAERARVATEGWGAQLLALQGDDVSWAGEAWNHGWDSTMQVLTLRAGSPARIRAGRRERSPDNGGPPARTGLSSPSQPAGTMTCCAGLEYLRKAGAEPDERMAEVVELVESKRGTGGRWLLDVRHPGWMPVEMGEDEGQPSRWTTLRVLRLLDWYSRRD